MGADLYKSLIAYFTAHLKGVRLVCYLLQLLY